jgi:hypothetical protein
MIRVTVSLLRIEVRPGKRSWGIYLSPGTCDLDTSDFGRVRRALRSGELIRCELHAHAVDPTDGTSRYVGTVGGGGGEFFLLSHKADFAARVTNYASRTPSAYASPTEVEVVISRKVARKLRD